MGVMQISNGPAAPMPNVDHAVDVNVPSSSTPAAVEQSVPVTTPLTIATPPIKPAAPLISPALPAKVN